MGERASATSSKYALGAQQAENSVNLGKVGVGDLVRTLGTAMQNTIDIAGFGQQAPHIGRYRLKRGDRDGGEFFFKIREHPPGEALKRRLAREFGQRRVEADQVGRLRAPFKPYLALGQRQ